MAVGTSCRALVEGAVQILEPQASAFSEDTQRQSAAYLSYYFRFRVFFSVWVYVCVCMYPQIQIENNVPVYVPSRTACIRCVCLSLLSVMNSLHCCNSRFCALVSSVLAMAAAQPEWNEILH